MGLDHQVGATPRRPPAWPQDRDWAQRLARLPGNGAGWLRVAWLAFALAFLWAAPGAVKAFDFQGEKSVVAVTRDGARTRIGSVSFSPGNSPGEHRFAVRIDPQVMKDHFLSMREFKCLPAAQEISCFVPYPYAQPGTVSADRLGWLEHSLLFFFKQPADFGAKLWNGIIFQLAVTPGALVGRPQAVDLNRIGVPPEKSDEPPYGRFDRDEFTPGARWLQELRIE